MIKTLSLVLISIAFVSFTGGAFAGGDASAGKDKSELCQGCHGPDGISVNPECPSLAGQKPGYIFKQVKDFQDGHRHNDTMSAMAAMAGGPQDIKDIAAYFASMESMSGKKYMLAPPPSDAKSIEKGKNIFLNGNPKTGLYGCVNCHGQDGKGKSASNQVFPIIGGQTKEYLAKQLKDFREGTRKNDPANMMMDIAKKLSDEEIEAITDYLASF